ncbi:hypothetical protein D0Z07_2207 [Hyphodiscus hymeniophilus]|uniref:Alpha-L-rhamnosidase C n=1 Tax=Hyphodiscus hymeniophilus TaxID=353542 RepID=A0A9P7AZ06_9HELO|nr:hypothetical protein D0Z07_2207 [Hyphodiscus hymeniophilus]
MTDSTRSPSPGEVGEAGEAGRARSSTAVSKSTNGRSRASTLAGKAQETFTQSRPPVGMFAAFGQKGSSIPTMADVQKGNFNSDGWSGPGQRRNSTAHRHTDWHVLHLHHQRKNSLAVEPKKAPIVEVEKTESRKTSGENDGIESSRVAETSSNVITPHDPALPYANGYQFPPKHTKWYSTKVFLIAFWKFFITPSGFLITIYGLNVVAWGGMLFLILCHATPAMGHPSYNDDYSGAKIWLEIDSQILTALFCVTAFGLIPWRFRDLYYLLQWRWRKNPDGLRRLAGIHRGWFRLQGSQSLNVNYHPATDGLVAGVDESSLAIPIDLSPDAPLTGERAPPTAYWKLDLVIWMMVANTLLQAILCGFMWGENRFHRPGWVTGLLISTGCIVAMVGGWYMFKEGKAVKKIEGVPVSAEDQEILRQMREKEGESV